MSTDITPDGRTTGDEKSSGSGKLELMSKEELIKLVKNQVLLKKKLEIKITELTNSNTSLTETEEELRKQIDDEQSKYSKLLFEFNEHKLEKEPNLTCESQNSELLSKFVSTTIDVLQLSIPLPDLIDNEYYKIYKDEIEQKQDNIKIQIEQIEQEKSHLQQRIEDLEFFNEEVKLEIDDLKLKSIKYQQDKQSMENEIDNYRHQIEDFEEQFLELQRETNQNRLDTFDKSQQQPSLTSSLLTLHQLDENIEEITLQCMDYILNQIDENNSRISKASSTSSLLLSSDIPTLLHSIGITSSTDDDFSVPLNFESVLRLCTLLIERCRVLQYILLKNNSISMNSLVESEYDNNSISFLTNNYSEQCKMLIHKQDHPVLDTLFERIYTGMNQTIRSNEWQIIIEKAIDQKTSPYIRLEFDNFKFVPDEIEHELKRLRCKFDELLKQNEEQQNEIKRLRLKSNNSLEYLKEHQTQLEEQLVEQCEKTIQLEHILKQENLDKIKFDQFKQIENSYNNLEEKYHIAEQLEEQLKQKDVQIKQQNDLFEKLKKDYDHQHFHLLEREENIRLLKLDIEQSEQSKENLIEKYRQQIGLFEKQIEQQKNLLLNAAQNQDQHYSIISKQKQELTDLIQIKTNENNHLMELNSQLEFNLKENKQIIKDKNQQIENFQKQLQEFQIKNEELQIKFNQIKEEKNKFTNEINSLMDNINNLEQEKSQLSQEINLLKQQLQTSNDKTINQVKHTIENVQPELDSNNQLLSSSSTDTTEQHENNLIANLQSELETVRQENEKLTQTLNELNMKTERQISDSDENIQELKEKYQKMKILLTRLRKELQDKNQQPKQSLMDLELADYDKTIVNLKNDLINKDKEIQDLRDELSNSTDKYACLKLEIENLEQQKIQTDQRANKFKALLDAAKKELQNAKDTELQRHYNDDHVRSLIEQLQSDLDKKKLLINELTNEKQQLTEKINNYNETSQRTIHLLEQNLSIAKHDLHIAKQDYDTLQDDFNGYKIRAQSVLKQHQSTQRERTPSLADKQAEFDETIEKLKITIREANEKIQLLNSENEALQKEQDRLIETQTKLINESRKREQDLRKQHQIEINKIEIDFTQRLNDSNDTIKNLTLQIETLSTAFKEQIATIESDHQQSISILENQLEISQQEIEQLKIRIEYFEQQTIDNEKITSTSDSSQIGINNRCNRDDSLAWSVSERQQAEEFNSSDVQKIVLNGTDKTIDEIEKKDLERQQSEDEVNKLKLRLINTTELLNESELNNERLIEQVALLKDEIRRIERNMDRAESISNLEYLKNIILKFFILKSSPERLQLIPVLVTMLKLSPDEQSQLVRVANLSTINDENLGNNESSSENMTNGANSPSWSSYLNIW